MAERIKVHYKCCCGAEIDIDVDEYKRTWLDERVTAFADIHKNCPEQMLRKSTEYLPLSTMFKPGVYATTNQAVVTTGNNQTTFSVVPDAFCRD